MSRGVSFDELSAKGVRWPYRGTGFSRNLEPENAVLIDEFTVYVSLQVSNLYVTLHVSKVYFILHVSNGENTAESFMVTEQ